MVLSMQSDFHILDEGQNFIRGNLHIFKQKLQILNVFPFQPNFAAALHILKVEIGGGSQSGSK